MKDSIRVLLVDDSPLVLAKLKQIIATSDQIEVVGTAKNGEEALKLIPEVSPTVICTDLYMPTMDGLAFTREVMAHHPTPILVVSIGVQEGDKNSIFELLKAGAVDVLPKPLGGDSSDLKRIEHDLIQKILILAGVKVFRRKKTGDSSTFSQNPGRSTALSVKPNAAQIILFGASTGGPQTLEKILRKLPADFSLPVVCIQHIGEEFIESMVQWMNAAVPLTVVFAEHGKKPEAGKVYFAPKGRQLEFFVDGSFDCQRAEPHKDFLPSVDLTFLSAALSFKSSALACILTGMGSDGSDGLRAIFESGGYTIAQSGESCVVDGMPKSARDAGVVSKVCDPESVGALLNNLPKNVE